MSKMDLIVARIGGKIEKTRIYWCSEDYKWTKMAEKLSKWSKGIWLKNRNAHFVLPFLGENMSKFACFSFGIAYKGVGSLLPTPQVLCLLGVRR